VVLSHGHFDHAGGLAGLAGTWGDSVAADGGAPEIWTRRRLAMPGPKPDQLPTLSKRALEGEGFAVIERREPSLLADGSVVTAARY
jgi:7,8-dihydropterin-6-yl-methyl-4-(beta-D-ribofuranosyl)aminobenzene 5'-phosphate synthase